MPRANAKMADSIQRVADVSFYEEHRNPTNFSRRCSLKHQSVSPKEQGQRLDCLRSFRILVSIVVALRAWPRLFFSMVRRGMFQMVFHLSRFGLVL